MKNLSYLTLTLCLFGSLAGTAQISGQRENLGTNINSQGNTDSAPVVTYDGKTMYFKRSVPGASYDYDIYFSTLVNNQWTKAQPLTELNNDKVSEVEYVYPDGKTMIVCGTFLQKSGIFYASLKAGKWEIQEQIELGLEMDANSDNLNVTMNSSQDVMIVSIHGDLFLSKKDNGKWSTAAELKSLNTAGYEYTPFLDYDDKTLYIAGTGYAGVTNGEADIFVVNRLDDTWTNWSQPEKVKGVINTDGWDSFFYISPSKDYVYVYNLNEGGGDILRIKNEVRPEVVTTNPVPVVPIVPVPTEEEIVNAEQSNVTEALNNEDANAANRAGGDLAQELENILVYPNPTKGQFNLVLHNSNESILSQIYIFDANLKGIENISTSQSLYSFDLSSYESGIYFVKIMCNGKSVVKKVVLEK